MKGDTSHSGHGRCLDQATCHDATTSHVGSRGGRRPIETVPQSELVDVPASMIRKGDTFVLRVKGESMQEDGILPGDLVVVQKQATARNGQTVVAL